MSETNTPPTTGSNEPTSKHTRSAQDKMIGAYITDAKKFLNVAATDAEIRPILEAHGYGDEEFTLGNALAKTASDAFEGRASGMGHQKLTGTALIAAIKTARENYAAFREIARASFPDEAERLALALTGGVPHDTSRFITIAETSYNAATKERYAAKITKRGYSAERLASLLQGLNDLTGTSGNQDTALGAAIDDTAARDEAYENLKSFMKELKGTARGALRGNPGLLAKLEL